MLCSQFKWIYFLQDMVYLYFIMTCSFLFALAVVAAMYVWSCSGLRRKESLNVYMFPDFAIWLFREMHANVCCIYGHYSFLKPSLFLQDLH